MIIGVSGKRGSGKDTFADFLIKNHGYVRVSFASPMKAFVSDVFDIDPKIMYGPSYMREEVDERWGRSPRELLQTLGTEWGRNMHPDVWVRYAMRDAKRLLAGINYPKGVQGVVITDIRFPNEMQVVKEEGGILVRILRPSAEKCDEASRHHSETALDSVSALNFNHVLMNDKSLEELEAWARVIAGHKKS